MPFLAMEAEKAESILIHDFRCPKAFYILILRLIVPTELTVESIKTIYKGWARVLTGQTSHKI